MILVLEILDARATERPKMFPGSPEAFDAGCLCPEYQPWPTHLHIHVGCPVHPTTKSRPIQ